MSTDGPIWVAERLNGKPVIRGTVLTLSTYEDSAGGYDGCNHFFGSHEDGSPVDKPDGTISFPGFGQTLVLCEYPRGTVAQQDRYLETLADARQYQVQGHRLQIRDGSGNLRLVMVNKSPLVGAAEDLTGTAWRLVSTDGKASRGVPPTLAFWDEAFVGGTVADYGFVAQYDKWSTDIRVQSTAVTGAETNRVSRIKDRKVRGFLQDIRRSGRHAVREEDGVRLLRIRTDQGYPLDFEELMPAVDNISGVEWRLQSFIEVRYHEFRAGGPPCVENALPGSDIVARFTATTVRGTVHGREYSRDDLTLSMVRQGESSTDGLAGLDPFSNDLPDGRCPREDGEEAGERDMAGQAERYLELLPKLQRYMIFGDRLVVLTDSHQALLFQAERSG
jgi:heat shock protein HslJ